MKKLWCSLFIALALNAVFTLAQGLAPRGLAAGDNTSLQLNCHNPAKSQELKPEWTVIVSAVKLTVKQMNTSRWEISFH